MNISEWLVPFTEESVNDLVHNLIFRLLVLNFSFSASKNFSAHDGGAFCVQGPQGTHGIPGKNGIPGHDGKDGTTGRDGE